MHMKIQIQVQEVFENITADAAEGSLQEPQAQCMSLHVDDAELGPSQCCGASSPKAQHNDNLAALRTRISNRAQCKLARPTVSYVCFDELQGTSKRIWLTNKTCCLPLAGNVRPDDWVKTLSTTLSNHEKLSPV